MANKCTINDSFNVLIDNRTFDDNRVDNGQYHFYFPDNVDRQKIAQLQKMLNSNDRGESDRAMKQLQSLSIKHSGQKAVAAAPVANAVTDNMRQLSGQASGTRRLRSHHGTYLRSYDKGLKVDMKTGAPGTWENWWVEDRKGKVVFKSIHAPGIFLSALKNNQVTLDYHVNASEFWTPKRNDNGSWSFQSCYGTWLCGHTDGRACLQPHRQAWEEFWLEWW